MVTLNAERCIEAALRSLKAQTYTDYELIVVDGGSQDRTLSIIDSMNIPCIKIISEPDTGIYDAMNKGIKRSSGEYLYFLNTDDRLYNSKILFDIDKYLSENDNPSLLYGDIINVYNGKESYHSHPDILEKKFFAGKTITHQAVFARKSLFEKFGYFDLRYMILADYVWLADIIILKSVDYLHINKPVSYYSLEGISSKAVYWLERHSAYRNYFSILELVRYFYYPWVYKRIKRRIKALLV